LEEVVGRNPERFDQPLLDRARDRVQAGIVVSAFEHVNLGDGHRRSPVAGAELLAVRFAFPGGRRGFPLPLPGKLGAPSAPPVAPPSTTISVPVTFKASSEAR